MVVKIKKVTFYIIISFIIFAINIIPSYSITKKDYNIETKQDLLILMLSYPEYIIDIEKADDKIYCILKSGKKILYDDKLEKTQEEKFSNADLQDTLEQYYPLNKNISLMDKSFNPGRCRNYQLLQEVYGFNKENIEKKLVNLKCGYPNYQFNSCNNANSALDNTLRELLELSKNNSDISNILFPCSGTFNYRLISGTNRLSPHSFGIAIDLKSDKKDYWKWSSKEDGEKRLNEYPENLVTVFEKNNFIWGGKWGYFDILHFEYRPEIILKARYFSEYNENSNWYESIPLNDEYTQKCIKIIENALK